MLGLMSWTAWDSHPKTTSRHHFNLTHGGERLHSDQYRPGAHVQIKTTLVSLVICSAIGAVVAAFSSLSWLAATCFAAAALLVNGALASWEDSRPGGFDNQDGTSAAPSPWSLWGVIAAAVAAAAAGALIQLS
jgi:hypothetical protein